MDKSDILGKAKRETNKRACMVDLTLKSRSTTGPFNSDLFFHQGLCITFLFPLLAVPLTSSW